MSTTSFIIRSNQFARPLENRTSNHVAILLPNVAESYLFQAPVEVLGQATFGTFTNRLVVARPRGGTLGAIGHHANLGWSAITTSTSSRVRSALLWVSASAWLPFDAVSA